MASHSCAVTVEVAPADSAVSVVGTGVELGARADAIFAIISSVLSWVVLLVRNAYALLRRGCTKSRLQRSGVGETIRRAPIVGPAYSVDSRTFTFAMPLVRANCRLQQSSRS